MQILVLDNSGLSNVKLALEAVKALEKSNPEISVAVADLETAINSGIENINKGEERFLVSSNIDSWSFDVKCVTGEGECSGSIYRKIERANSMHFENLKKKEVLNNIELGKLYILRGKRISYWIPREIKVGYILADNANKNGEIITKDVELHHVSGLKQIKNQPKVN